MHDTVLVSVLGNMVSRRGILSLRNNLLEVFHSLLSMAERQSDQSTLTGRWAKVIKPATMPHIDLNLTPKDTPSLGGCISRLPHRQEARLIPIRPQKWFSFLFVKLIGSAATIRTETHQLKLSTPVHMGLPKDTLEAYSEAYACSSLAKLSGRPGFHFKGL